GPEPWDVVPPPSATARAYSVANPDFSAEARLAAALEEIAGAGVANISAAVADRVGEALSLADEFAIGVVSPRAEHERAGIVILDPPEDQVALLSASLHNHGVTTTTRQNRNRLSVHAGTTSETLGMLRDSFVSFSTAGVNRPAFIHHTASVYFPAMPTLRVVMESPGTVSERLSYQGRRLVETAT